MSKIWGGMFTGNIQFFQFKIQKRRLSTREGALNFFLWACAARVSKSRSGLLSGFSLKNEGPLERKFGNFASWKLKITAKNKAENANFSKT